MPRLHLTVEGQTEQVFAHKLLIPHLAAKGVYLSKPQLAAHARRRGVAHRGGVLSYLPFRNDVLRRLKEDASSDVFFSMMIDLYGLPNDFPGSEAARSERDPYRRAETIERALTEDLGDGRFIAYVQLHEFEALLLADPGSFATYYVGQDRQIEELVNIAAEFQSPELIDDGDDTAPSKRIASLIPDYARAKPTVAPIIAEKIGLPTIRAKCLHFNDWLTKLEGLGAAQRAPNR